MNCGIMEKYLPKVLLLVLIVVLIIFADKIYSFFFVKYKTNHAKRLVKISPFTQKDTHDINYEKELNLFKSLTPEQQSKYLTLTKDEKIAEYGAMLM